MNIGLYAAEQTANLSTILLHLYFMNQTMEHKSGSKNYKIAVVVFVFVRMSYYVLGLEYRPYFATLTGIAFALLVYRGNLKTSFVWATIPVILDRIVDTIVFSLFLLIRSDLVDVNMKGLDRICFLLTANLIMLVVCKLATRKVDKNQYMNWIDCFTLLVIPVSCWIILVLLHAHTDELTKIRGLPLFISMNVFLLLMISNTIAHYNRTTMQMKELAQAKMRLHISDMTQKHIDEINIVYSKLSSLQHDLRNHFIAMSGYLTSHEYEAAERYVDSISGMSDDQKEHSSHPVLNALLCARYQTAQNAAIDFDVDLGSMPDEMPITDVELCVMFGNILDNAFDATMQQEGAPYIRLSSKVNNTQWVIACRNSTSDKRSFIADGFLKSTKTGNIIHGIGTKQINGIAEKYNGFVTYRHENYEFAILVTIRLI